MAVRRSVAWMVFGQGTLLVLQFIGSIVVARLLGPRDMGIFAVAMAAVGVIGLMQALGLGSFLVRERDLTPDLIATAATVDLGISIVMAMGIAGLALLGGILFHEPGVRDVLLVIAVVPVIGHFAFVPQAMIERDGDFRLMAIVRAASSAIGLIITIALARAGYRYMALAYSQVANALITNIALNIIGRRHFKRRFSLRHWSRVARFGAQIFAIAGITQAASRLMDLVLGRVQGLAALGLYSRASSNHAMLWGSVHGVVGSVVFVDLARHRRDGIPLAPRYLQVLELMTGLMWPLLAGVAVLARPLVGLIYGPVWLGAAAPLSLLCIASVLLVSTTMTWEIFVVFEETARQVRLEVIRTVAGTVLFVACCFYSLQAAAAARVGEAVLAQYIYRPHLERLTGATTREFQAVYWRSGLAALAAVTPAAVLMAVTGFRVDVGVPLLALVVATGGAGWLLALRALDHAVYREFTIVARRFPPARVLAP